MQTYYYADTQSRQQQKLVSCKNTELDVRPLKHNKRHNTKLHSKSRIQTVTLETWYNLQGREKIPFPLLILRRI